jgi:methionyl-tRNA synthetase
MVEKNCAAVIPKPVTIEEGIGLQNSTAVVISGMRDEYTTYSFTRVIASIQSSIGNTDSYFSENAPWKLAKSGEGAEIQRLHTVLYTAAESIRIITALLYPILPYATAKIWSQLGLGDIEAAAKSGELKNLEWGGLKPGTKLGPLAPIFPRADKGLIQIMTDMEQKSAQQKSAETKALPHFNLEIDNLTEARTEFRESSLASQTAIQAATKAATQSEGSRHTDPTHPAAPPRTSAFSESDPGAQVGGSNAISTERIGTPSHTEAAASGIFATASAPSAAPDTPQITIEDFVKIDLRVAEIVVAERIPKADKLLRLEVDLGYEKRQILSGIAQWYTPEELLGRKIVIIANLAPRKMRGLESHGMLLAASHGEDGKPVLATFAENIVLGSRLR